MPFQGVLFSDVHLAEGTTRLNELFAAFVQRVRGTPEIACLGDLSEYWIGRKHLQDAHGKWLFNHMRELAQGARRAVWVAGNRDFLFDAQARQAGWQVCRNQYRGEFCGLPVALEHGDRFCSLDKGYQRFRWWFRKVPWSWLGIVLSARRGHALARYFRGKSMGETARKQPSLFGIQPQPVQTHVAAGAGHVFCGHVHTPFERNYDAAGRTGSLHVLGDWRPDGAVVAVVQDGRPRLVRFDGDKFLDFEAPNEQKTFAPGEEAART
ncbi:MAG: hypothetical protein IT463_10275 [Planctomycetes bacterium]|nr:hypothetical protein [Planctomycetota bacterium]